MRLGYCTWGMIGVDIEESLPAIAKIGYTGVELAVTPRFTTELYSLTPARRRRIGELLDAHGLTLTAIAAHTSLSELDPDTAAANMQRLRDALDLAVELAPHSEQPMVITLVGGRSNEWDDKREMIAQRVHQLGEDAAQRDVMLAIEPHSGNALDTPEKAVWLMEAVDHPAVRLNFDISHFEILGLDTEETVAQMVPYAVHTHVKDQRGRYPNHEFLTPGAGPSDYVRYLRAMDQAGYQGVIAVEVSVMVQNKAGYDPFVDAALGYYALLHAFNESRVPLDTRRRTCAYSES